MRGFRGAVRRMILSTVLAAAEAVADEAQDALDRDKPRLAAPPRQGGTVIPFPPGRNPVKDMSLQASIARHPAGTRR